MVICRGKGCEPWDSRGRRLWAAARAGAYLRDGMKRALADGRTSTRWTGAVLLLLCCVLLVSNVSCRDSEQKLNRAAIRTLEETLEGFEASEDLQNVEAIEQCCNELRRILRILKAHPDRAVPPTPFFCELGEFEIGKDVPEKRIQLQWVETANEVTGFFLVLDEQTLEFPVLDPSSEGMQELAATTAWRFQVVFILDAGLEEAEDFEDLGRHKWPHVSLTPNVVGRLFSKGRGPAEVGLLLGDGWRSATCELFGPHSPSPEPRKSG